MNSHDFNKPDHHDENPVSRLSSNSYPQDSIEIRSVTMQDAVHLCRIAKEEMGYSCTVESMKERILKLQPQREEVLVAVIGDQTVGFIHMEIYQPVYLEPMVNLLGLAVTKAHQHSGIGTALLNAAEAWARKQGITTMRLNSGKEREDAHRFYEHLGYHKSKKQFRFIKKLS